MADDPFAAIATPVAQGDPFASIATPSSTPAPTKTPGELKASFADRLTSSYDPGAADFDERHPILGKPVRALSSLGGTALSIPSGLYHLFADAPTEEEKKEHEGALIPPTSMLARPVLAAERIAKPVEEAIDTYANPKTRPTVKQAASVLPEALGVGAGQYVGGELVGRSVGSLSKVGELRKSAAEKVQGFARKATGVETAVKESVGKAAEKQGEALTEHADQTENLGHRTELAKTIDTKSQALGKHLKTVEQSVRKEGDLKYDAVREKLGISDENPGPQLPPDTLVSTVRNVEEQTLQGIPENIKEFRSILSHGAEVEEGMRGAFKEATGQDALGGKPMTWDKLQSLKTRIEARLRKSGGMNPDLKRGLYQTHDVVLDEMGKIAVPGGAGDLWADARNFWRQYKEDFHDSTGPSGSGSPVAQSLNAVDPQNIRQPFLRTQSSIGNRGTEILRKYPQHGGNEAAAAVDEIVGHHQELQNTPNRPKGFSPDKPPAAPTVDVNKVSREKIAQVAKNWGSTNARDIGIIFSGFIGGAIQHILSGGGFEFPAAVVAYEGGKQFMSRTLNRPGVIEWLAKTPPEEIRALNTIPGADKIKIADGLTQIAVSTGKPVQLSPAAKAFLGARNAARIMAVSTPSVVKTPGEAKDRARKLATNSN